MPLSVVFESWIYSLVKNTKDPYFGFNVILKIFNLIIDLLISLLIIFLPNLIKNTPTIDLNNRILISSMFFASPSISFISNIWGQNDSLIALFAILGITTFYLKNFHIYSQIILSSFFITLGFWIKQQTILALPAVFSIIGFQKK
ncbi:hypothetical protein HC864_02225 [Candidatus Gracilibacteria bacterium]|nr:hypothetical protein [Candidatus Gracilibacteria bacterium]